MNGIRPHFIFRLLKFESMGRQITEKKYEKSNTKVFPYFGTARLVTYETQFVSH